MTLFVFQCPVYTSTHTYITTGNRFLYPSATIIGNTTSSKHVPVLRLPEEKKNRFSLFSVYNIQSVSEMNKEISTRRCVQMTIIFVFFFSVSKTWVLSIFFFFWYYFECKILHSYCNNSGDISRKIFIRIDLQHHFFTLSHAFLTLMSPK